MTRRDTKQGTKQGLTLLAGLGIGAALMYVLDPQRGVVRGRWSRRRETTVPDETLVARVRSRLGHHVEHPHAIEVIARDGVVTLRGTVPSDELDDAIIAAREVSGVTLVESELDVLGASAASSDYDGTG